MDRRFTESQRTAKALPRLDEDDRLVPILNHLSLGFTAPEYSASSAVAAMVNATNVDQVNPSYLMKLMPHCSWSSTFHCACEIYIKRSAATGIFGTTADCSTAYS